MNIRLTSLLVASVALLGFSAAAPQVHPGVHRALRATGAVNLMIVMETGTDAVLESLEETEFDTRDAQIEHVVSSLQAENVKVTAPIEELLAQHQEGSEPQFTSHKNFWINNYVYIEGATAELVDKLTAIPSIKTMREEIVLPLPTEQEPSSSNTTNADPAATVQWGIDKIQAPKVWTSGVKGDNVVVGIIDTGARSTHETIRSNYRGSYGWFDPFKQSKTPSDFHGHGTHVTGTAVGSKGIGVAPGAKWMMCQGCAPFGCPESALLACAQFMTCPTSTDGDRPNCSKAPHLVSNSWGGGQEDDFYAGPIKAWRKAGIIPVFALGNSGPSCRTAMSPGDSADVIGVGSSTINDALSYFSSKGPTAITRRLKPEISAPGSSIVSASSNSDTGLRIMSGTSMATPHVSGVIALMLSTNQKLKYDSVRSILTSSADRQSLENTNHICGGIPDAVWPNNQWGYGRLNAYNAYVNSKTA